MHNVTKALNETQGYTCNKEIDKDDTTQVHPLITK